jgi:hypothetical protein
MTLCRSKRTGGDYRATHSLTYLLAFSMDSFGYLICWYRTWFRMSPSG